jgi:RNase P protein component
MLKTGVDLSVVVKPGAARLSHGEIDQQLLEALQRLQVSADA